MSLALIITDRSANDLVKHLKQLKPGLDIQVWPEIKHPEKVEFTVVWKQPLGIFSSFANLKIVSSLGAGIDFISKDNSLNKNIPIFRIVTSNLQKQMAQYVLAYVLSDYRELVQYKKQQSKMIWKINPLNDAVTVGFLGLGEIGKFVAIQLKQLGLKVVAYTQRSLDQEIDCYQGTNGLQKVMAQSDYIVCLLPLTNQTENILNKQSFSMCKKRPMLIHVGRGEQLVEEDLIDALDTGMLKHAVLDVFRTEPLTKEHTFWNRSDISITPHNSARSDTKQTAEKIIQLYDKYILSNS
jgi:glyoxylate/hydroxypyruvate reductase A